ncbi:catalase family peroxidase [Paraburkholderia sp. Tr-20389]|uniref:catalase family peroxidase n=1 Tax=Paraburkholderia sp. Tr-20389 TaxID=2703903 RepID=UPI00197E3C4C|nr:catalase family peroxidase [Paraburkholderia sp. Tr-20389]MBN3751810.1 catalase family peroxidase [Paraburkholderia sp. Tr-20389]
MSRFPFRTVAGGALAVVTLGTFAGAYAITHGFAGLLGTQPSATQIIDRFESVSGKHAGFRRNHAKGVCVTGYFDSNGNAAPLSRASVFAAGRSQVVGRLSIGGGNPAQADGASNVRSLALRIVMPDGSEWRTAMNSAPIFPVRTPEALFDMLAASRQARETTTYGSDAGMDAFMKAHPETARFEQWQHEHPPSSAFGNAAYYSVSAFRLIDRDGRVQNVRWRVEPDDAYVPLADAQKHDSDFLERGLAERLQQGSLRWHMVITLAQAGDVTNDSTRQWPANRTQIDVGTLVVQREEAQIDGPCRDISFDPLTLPDGIAPSDDPLLHARSAAYAESHERRVREEQHYTARR